MATVKGPFKIRWGSNPIVLVSELSNNYEQDSEDVDTFDGSKVTFDGAISASVDVSILANDIPALAALLPQYFVATGNTMSTGETVTSPTGAIDINAAGCDAVVESKNLDIISCGNPGQVYRLVNARTKLSAVDFETTHRVITISFIGVPESGKGVVQFFSTVDTPVVS